MRHLRRHPFIIYLHYFANAAIAACVGLVYMDAGYDTWGIQNRMGSLFFILVYLALLSLR